MIKINRVDVNDLDSLSKIDVENFEDAWTYDKFKSKAWTNLLYICYANVKIKRCKKSISRSES